MSQVIDRNNLENDIITKIADHLGRKNITKDTSFQDLGLDSLELVELSMEVEKEYSVTLDNEKLNSVKTVGEFMDLVVDSGANHSANNQ